MHSFRMRYTALGLLIYISSAYSWSCVSDFEDIGSRTALADIVLVGGAYRRIAIPDKANFSQIKFLLKDIIKWSPKDGAPKDQSRGSSRNTYITVTEFGPFANPDVCTAAMENITMGDKYLLFLRRTKIDERWSSSSSSSSSSLITNDSAYESDSSSSSVLLSTLSPSSAKDVVYHMSSFPEPASKEAVKEARTNACAKCPKPPRVNKISPDKTEKVGRKIRLQCRVSGIPRPFVTWYKDGKEVTSDNRTSFITKRNNSILQIKNAILNDTGSYQCLAINVAGKSIVRTRLVVRSNSVKPHSVPCPPNSHDAKHYCFSGGTCYKTIALNKTFCECAGDEVGARCEEKDIGYNAQLGRKRRHLHHRQSHHPQTHNSENVDENRTINEKPHVTSKGENLLAFFAHLKHNILNNQLSSSTQRPRWRINENTLD